MTAAVFLKDHLRPALLTVIMVAIGALCAYYLWQTYLTAPWTRAGRLRAEIAEIAPQVSGNIVRLAVQDNGFVKQGDVILEIDPSNYQIAVAQSESELAGAEFKEKQLASSARRLDKMPSSLVSAEQLTTANMAWKAQQEAVKTAQSVLNQARLNLERTLVKAPFDGFVTNMDLRVGSWLTAGQPVLAFVSEDNYFVVGYFQETRLQGICPDAPATITFLGEDNTYHGRVISIGRGIADSNQNTSSQLLANVDQTFPWIRLAQRIPVRVAFDTLPPSQALIAGRTVSIAINSDKSCP